MGCLNSDKNFSHWFGNIHLSGPCNRSCYFCIGQHMMDLDKFNNLDRWPLKNIKDFVADIKQKRIKEINLTGTNTDPMLYRHHGPYVSFMRQEIEGCRLGIRTNGVTKSYGVLDLYDKISLSIHSLDPAIYRQIMGNGEPPNVSLILSHIDPKKIKVNLVMVPENIKTGDVFKTLDSMERAGIKRLNLREPYGQPNVGCPLRIKPSFYRFGMPVFEWKRMEVMYWDVHYVEVESLNLYASGRISETYPITKGHSENGVVKGQENFKVFGRQQDQWLAPLANPTPKQD